MEKYVLKLCTVLLFGIMATGCATYHHCIDEEQVVIHQEEYQYKTQHASVEQTHLPTTQVRIVAPVSGRQWQLDAEGASNTATVGYVSRPTTRVQVYSRQETPQEVYREEYPSTVEVYQEVVETPYRNTVTNYTETIDVDTGNYQDITQQPIYRRANDSQNVYATRDTYAYREEASQPQYIPLRDDDLFPPNAKPGECYARVFIPPQYEMRTEQVLVGEASEKIEVVPAQYERVQEQVLVQEASERIVEVIPARYEYVSEQVRVKEATERLEVVPAEYRTITERIIEQPGYVTWKQGRGPYERMDHATGEIMCLVEVPPQYKTVTKRELVSASQVRRVTVPAEYTTVQKRVMVAPPQVRKEIVPAQYKTVTVTRMVTPPQERRMQVPAQYETITKRSLVGEGKMAWSPVLCETNATRANIVEIQRALKNAGYYTGAIDGIIGRLTLDAARRYQQTHNLAQGGITYELIRSLGITLG